MSNNNYNPFEDNHYYDDINNPFEDSANNKTAQKLKTFNQNKKYKAKSFLDKGYFKQQKDKTRDSINNYPDSTPVNKQVSKDILKKIPNIKPRIKTPTINVDTDEENGFKVVSIILSLIVLIGTIFGGMFEDSDIFDDNDFIVPDTQLESIYEFYDCIIEDTNYENFDTTPIKNAVNWEDATNISAEDSFPIFTLFFISLIFLFLMLELSESYIPFSSDLVSSTILPDDSNKFCTFFVITRFILSSVTPELPEAPSSGWPCPASNIITLFVTGKLETDTIF